MSPPKKKKKKKTGVVWQLSQLHNPLHNMTPRDIIAMTTATFGEVADDTLSCNC